MRRCRVIPVVVLSFGIAGCSQPAQPPVAVAPPPSYRQAPKPFFSEVGLGSWYGQSRQGKTTADGERFNDRGFTCAQRTLPFGTILRVTNLQNGRTVKVRVNDRGPAEKSRIIDLSAAAARALGMHKQGVATVRLEAFSEDQARG